MSKQPKRRMRMATQSCRFSSGTFAEKEANTEGQNPSVWYWHSIINIFFLGKLDSDEKTSWPEPTTLRRPLLLAIGPVAKIDATVASQSSYTRVFASSCRFQDVCGEVIELVQDRPPFISNLLWGAFRYPTDIDFHSDSTTAFVSESLLAVNTWHVQIPLLRKLVPSLSKFSAKFVFRILLCVWISMIIQEM